ncbi:alkyl hydroperoxide reductase [Bacillus sp. J14TS2]|uniref:peroxiredoxin-like family protein n=1 Tax=Bacillus sp. J14TS2 TaxID=2807188 RepID=UPI001B234898|nr:peroxiredoxin-like family protein [Bacillus sp. J14TS2]GIN71726.1 alkyl hydroperoxide reductase [Bacillus sp. J14TS2]
MEKTQFEKLQDELDSIWVHGKKTLPTEVVEAFEKSIQDLRNSNSARGLVIGEKAPDFTLEDQIGKNITLSKVTAKGPVILTFYRGLWCPFCNVELRGYQQIIDNIHATGAQLLAISPLTPEHTLSVQEKHELSFHVLSDLHNQIAEKYRLKFKVPGYLHDIYRSLDFALDKYNGDNFWELPVPATYIIDQQGVIRFANVDPDYRRRTEPGEVLNFLRSL